MRYQFVYIICIIILFASCAKNASKELNREALKAPELLEENTIITIEDAYKVLVKQKLQEQLDKKELAQTYPDFATVIHEDILFSNIDESVIKEIHFITPFITVSDSLQTVKTQVVFESKTDTLITKIKTSEIYVEGEKLKTHKVSFEHYRNPKTKTKSLPAYPERFSINDLNFSWEDINACDCLFMAKMETTDYERLYFGRLIKGDSAIMQLGKRNKKLVIPVLKSRSKNRKPGNSWKETYQNNEYHILLNAQKAQPKVKGKYSYFIDLEFKHISSKKVIKKVIITNCKS